MFFVFLDTNRELDEYLSLGGILEAISFIISLFPVMTVLRYLKRTTF